MWNWFVAQYNDIKGNLKWALLLGAWWFMSSAAKIVIQHVPSIPAWMVWTVTLCLAAAAFVWIAKSVKTSQPSQVQPSRALVQPGLLTLSALQGQTPQVGAFNAREWFRLSYHSPVTAEIENNIKIIAEQNQPGDHESFYARFIGVGLVSYFHDMTWAYIFKSQLLLLAETNRRIVHQLPLSDAKVYYDRATEQYPKVYENYSFQQWMNYMFSEQLLIKHPSDMLEITYRGNDLLKYLAHWGT
jgi:hypothetical protein